MSWRRDLALVAVSTAFVLAAACASPAPPSSSTGTREATSSGGATETSPSAGATPSTEPTALPLFPGTSAFANPKDNPYFPLTVGKTWTYEGESDGDPSRDVVTMSGETTTILGVKCVVSVDKVYVNGVLQENTKDYFAASDTGDVWYFGEDTAELDEKGKVTSTEGTWRAGVDGAKPGIIMKADPKIGDTYLQEFLKGHAEDMARVVSLSESETVPFGSFSGVLKTNEWSPLEPGILDEKSYARGIGEISERTVKGGNEEFKLVSVK